MKTLYEVPEMEVVTFDSEDVICTSGGLDFGGDGDGDHSDWPFG